MIFQMALYALFMDFSIRRTAAFGLLGFKRRIKKWKKRADVTRIVFFMFDVEPWSPSKMYKKFMRFTPFKYDEATKKYVLSEWNEKYWEKLEKFVSICSKVGVLVIPNIFPCRYVGEVFRRSVENEGNRYPYDPIWSEQLRPFEFALIDRTVELVSKYYDEPWVSLSNEASHAGNHEQGFDLAIVHKLWLERTGLPLERVMLDSSKSEFVHAELVEPHEAWGRVVGDEKYSRLKNHHVICEHGIGLDEHVSALMFKYDGSVWDRRTHSVFSSDGNIEGSGDKYALFEIAPYVNASNAELYEKYLTMWSYSKDYIGEELPMEIWFRTPDDNRNALADYKKLKLGRLRSIREARNKLQP